MAELEEKLIAELGEKLIAGRGGWNMLSQGKPGF
jgi:hypothetical protein